MSYRLEPDPFTAALKREFIRSLESSVISAARAAGVLEESSVSIPRIDPNVRHISVGQMRNRSVEDIKKFTHVINEPQGTPIAVVVPYEQYMALQGALEAPVGDATLRLTLGDQVGRPTPTERPATPTFQPLPGESANGG